MLMTKFKVFGFLVALCSLALFIAGCAKDCGSDMCGL